MEGKGERSSAYRVGLSKCINDRNDQNFSRFIPFYTCFKIPLQQLEKSQFQYSFRVRCMISSSCFSPEQLVLRIFAFTSLNQFSIGFNCGEQGGRQRICIPISCPKLTVCSLSWIAQLSSTSHFSRLSPSSAYSSSRRRAKSCLIKSRYSYFLYVPSMIRQWVSPSSAMMAMSENRFPFEMGQFTVISSLGLAQALSLVMQRLNPLSSRKQTCALLSQSAWYCVQQSCRFYSDLVVFLSFGTHFTLFFLNLPTFSNRATVVLVISIFSPSFVYFKSYILLSSTVNSFCVRKGFSLISLATCSNLSRVILRSGIFFLISRLMRSQNYESSIHSAYNLVMVLQFMLKICPISRTDILVPFSSQLCSCAQYSSNFFFSSQRVFFVSFFLLPDLLRFLPIGSSYISLTYRRSFLALAYYCFNYCFILLAYCFIYLRFSRIASPTSVRANLSQVLPEY